MKRNTSRFASKLRLNYGGGGYNTTLFTPIVGFANGGFLNGEATFTRASSAGTWVNGVWTTFATNVPRFGSCDNDSYSGLVMEGVATNLLPYSTPVIAGWAENMATLTANAATSPDNTVNASTITMQAIAGGSGVYAAQGADAETTYTYSFLVKHISGTSTSLRLGSDFALGWGSTTAFLVTFDTATNTFSSIGSAVTAYSSIACANGWYYVELTGTTIALASFTTMVIYNAVASTGVYAAWGCQIEANSFGTSRILTTGATATRAADVCSITSLNTKPWWNATEGTLVVDFQRGAGVDTNTCALSIDDGNITSNGILIQQSDSVGSLDFNVQAFVGSGLVISQAVSSGNSNIRAKIAVAYKNNDWAICVNGGTVYTFSVAVPASITTMRIGKHTAISDSLNGVINNVTDYPSRLPNATLQALTV